MAYNRTNYFAFLLCMFATSWYLQATSLSFGDHESMSLKHENWMAQYRRYYETEEERQKRFKIFKDNVEYIESFNRAGNQTYKLGINEFADLTKEEFLAKYAGNFRPSSKMAQVSSFEYENMAEVPPSLDWRLRNAVTPVKNQGQCGCCWAFSAVAAIEGIVNIRSGVLTSLSEQQILDCNAAGEGCRGGRQEHAFEFVMRNGGLASDKDYPYQSSKGTCSTGKPSSLAVEITGYQRVQPKNETAMLMAVAQQPVAVGIDPSLMQLYKSGVITGACGNHLVHSVTAVGYGTNEDGTKFWLLKNSWGPNWGEGGYVRMQRDIEAGEGMCGLAIDVQYPTA